MIEYIVCFLAGMVIGAVGVTWWALSAGGKENDDGESV